MFLIHDRSAVCAIALAAAVAGCSQESADRAAKAVEKLPAQAERQAERATAALDDASITAKVKSALISDASVKAYVIDVDTKQNVVTLSGTVASEDVSSQAEKLARGVEGVKEVRNQLLVKAT